MFSAQCYRKVNQLVLQLTLRDLLIVSNENKILNTLPCTITQKFRFHLVFEFIFQIKIMQLN